MKAQICIISGSTLGGAEYVAEHLEDVFRRQGYPTRLEHGASFDAVSGERLWLVVTSTHGAGELPDNLRPLFTEINRTQPDLSGLRFAVVGLGNSDYDTFCYAVNEVEKALSERGAVRVCPSLKMDVSQIADLEQAAEDWLPDFTAQL